MTLVICDNNSKDDTEQVVREFESQNSAPAVVYVKETNQGLSHSRNAGIRAGKSEIIGFIDDDEEIRDDWYKVVAREFADPETQFIGGCCSGELGGACSRLAASRYHAGDWVSSSRSLVRRSTIISKGI